MCTAPVSGSLSTIASGAPVYIGESNLDISRALEGCHTIAWWKNGTDSSAPPAKNITLVDITSISDTASQKIYHYSISPEIFTNYTGKWYCGDKKPTFVVFEVFEPSIDISVWDLDHNLDVSEKSVPLSTNITYRIDTNMAPVLNALNRPDMNPGDSFYTVTLVNPYKQPVGNIYTGSAGTKNTQIISFDTHPFITASPYYWKNGKDWDHTARNKNGEPLYPPGTYTFTVSQNLNNMKDTYSGVSGSANNGKITQTATVNFVQVDATVTTPVSPQTVTTTLPVTTDTATQTATVTVFPTTAPTSSVVPTKTTYSPLPEWIALLGIVMAGLVVISRRR
ncbi:MAG: DUF3821 domain-containing protein [Methanoregula sp.]|nr:DUF3821 domain-containing protein [Methanoregula sp.]